MDMMQAVWRKSTYSSGNGGQCVDVTTDIPGTVALRDSRYPAEPALLVRPAEWDFFLGGVKNGAL
ncbi:hypothetical protein Sru01_19450 [Sphaerisporangium rufum]|uniref:DUF397 domain-containing protein n=1 Tax=Sphaerisporangium rufum TaxID=1381558 RepID=A0A919V0Q1_9ACTN|nr:DUF397 domain-containing protein [Sphaerisporangium rufum]GII76963.1 hypothetical protein Sru01_19450 [Sphaerisporangium rufum]